MAEAAELVVRQQGGSGHHDISTERTGIKNIGALMDRTAPKNNVTGSSDKETGAMNSSMPIENRARLPVAAFAQLAQAVAGHKSIKHALDWLRAHKPPLTFSDMVTQDEFSHDILAEYPGELYLAYDVTWFGVVTAVAVWDHKPTADELLRARLARGWVPTPTATVDGKVVLGHAACVVAGSPCPPVDLTTSSPLWTVEPIVPDRNHFDVLRGIAGAGFDYSATKRLCSGAGWQPVEDEPDLGFLQYFLWVGPGIENRRLLTVGTPETAGMPHVYLPLFYFPEEEGSDPQEHERTAFDEAYRRLSDGFGAILGEALHSGTYEYAHRPGWLYSFRTWRLPEAQVILLQDERDIQFGMDVSMWLFPAEPDVSVPLAYWDGLG